ncbi:MAG: thiamine pyrophosphate-binding protein [Sphingomonadales bacterium CG12_big_fil_rev_8_21_14_0_65_65_10]|uniref:thiamine pyrophosphate-dependent enzyme n=1 Tax=Blastomonas marina TaxID=1867408 RepID=UPI000CA935AD|nr:thiamine pyrophosphate-dependent enzyme [Blastomonas marina]PIW56217.1 MAG: thiamine pyrophosphate-binding protein [Sphingomonadales bacterium CG12_big_fil_rev_8_21_14_0_65_65_10]WPZ05029.1 thiamine pyrophosphate-binding protein [Blastomonas marina]
MTEHSKLAGRLLVDCLLEQGCDRIFTVPGESFLAVLDGLHDVPAIDTVVCRQEGGAAFMACADGAMTGRPGVCFVTRGPGATNASIGVHVAHQDSQPMILFVGDVDRGMKDREGFQELDFQAVFGPMCKWAARIDDAARIPEYVARAWSVAIAGRPGPVVLALPEDMLREEIDGISPRPQVVRPAQAACPDAMGALMAMLGDAVAPIAIVGGAGWNAKARDHFTAFAEAVGLPVAGAFRRQDAVPNSSSVWAGNLGYGPNPKLIERVRAADLVIAVGARLGEATTDGYELLTPDHPDQTLVHVHPDPEELGRVYRADLAICADMAEFSESAALLADEVIDFDAGAEAHREWIDWSTPQASGTSGLDLALAVKTMRELLPADAIICNGAGNFSGWWHRYWPYEGYPSQLAPTAGAMGYGVPAAVAAARRFPDRSVVAVAGDGDFLMNGQELATAAALDLDLLVLVIDNGVYGTIRMHQERDYPARVSGTTLANPDFARFGEAFGAWTATADDNAGFDAAIKEAAGRSGLRLIHCRTEIENLAASGLKLSTLRSRA